MALTKSNPNQYGDTRSLDRMHEQYTLEEKNSNYIKLLYNCSTSIPLQFWTREQMQWRPLHASR